MTGETHVYTLGANGLFQKPRGESPATLRLAVQGVSLHKDGDMIATGAWDKQVRSARIDGFLVLWLLVRGGLLQAGEKFQTSRLMATRPILPRSASLRIFTHTFSTGDCARRADCREFPSHVLFAIDPRNVCCFLFHRAGQGFECQGS
jgi:hypothetical protein